MSISKISPLKKVSLAIELASQKDRIEFSKDHFFTFIYGAASRGLCPFEIHLASKHLGETFQLKLSQEDIHEFFGHLLMPLKNFLNLYILPKELYFEVSITKIDDAQDREIITAMKDYAGSSCGSGGGCGCH